MAIVISRGHPLRPAVIPLEDAWRWSDLIGNPQVAAARVLSFLGIDHTNDDNRFKLIGLVNSRMQDLLSMPPRPQDAEEHAEPLLNLTTNDPLHGKIEVEL
jgi:hypothetical protein